jgi:NAD(P)-dependent dehydrogenase (short-subunit alcohol dehydrogenase family)
MLQGRVCVITGASRGIGKGIALALCSEGATVYITGRTLGDDGEGIQALGSLTRTAAEASARGGHCIAVQCDHADDKSTAALFERVANEQDGQLDLLVNNCYAAAAEVPMGMKFFEKPLDVWDKVHNVGLRSHYIASVFAAKIMSKQSKDRPRCIINISSAAGMGYTFDTAYGVGKAAVDRLAADLAYELKEYNVSCLSLWPGVVKTEYLVGNNMKVGNIELSEKILESPEFTGRAVAALMGDPGVMGEFFCYVSLRTNQNAENILSSAHTGNVFQCSEVSEMYGFTDIDGRKINPLVPSKALDMGIGVLRSSRLKMRGKDKISKLPAKYAAAVPPTTATAAPMSSKL